MYVIVFLQFGVLIDGQHAKTDRQRDRQTPKQTNQGTSEQCIARALSRVIVAALPISNAREARFDCARGAAAVAVFGITVVALLIGALKSISTITCGVELIRARRFVLRSCE